MTNSALDPYRPVEASPDGIRRTLDLARRALRARDSALMPPDPYLGDEDSAAVLTAAVAPGGRIIATLVVRDAAERLWSQDDEAMLRDLADSLVSEIALHAERGRPSRLPDDGLDAVADAVPAPDAEPPAIDDAGDPSSRRILLADDLDLNRKLISDMLSLDGYVVDSVADGAAALEAVQARSYDLVLMDMIMPGMDGMEATRAIRALPAPTCDVPIVALTAHSFREQLENCLDAGMNATLTKPMSFDALSEAVATWARPRGQAAA